ncbi:hypothetical protein EHM76_00465, partial [bacterium]
MARLSALIESRFDNKGTENAKRGFKDLDKTGEELARSVKKSNLSFTELASAVGLAQKGFSIAKQVIDQVVDKFVDAARQTRDFSTALGISAEEASRLIQVGDDLDINAESLKTGFRSLIDNGIQPNIASLKDLAAEYQGMTDPVKKAQFAMDLFGQRAGPELQKLLAASPQTIDDIVASAERSNLILGDDAVMAAESYRLAVDALKDSWDGLVYGAGQELIPTLVKLIDYINAQAKPGFREMETQVFKTAASYDEYVTQVTNLLQEQGFVVKQTEEGTKIYREQYGALVELSGVTNVMTREEYALNQATTTLAGQWAASDDELAALTAEVLRGKEAIEQQTAAIDN